MAKALAEQRKLPDYAALGFCAPFHGTSMETKST
jgi:hypothetical protein